MDFPEIDFDAHPAYRGLTTPLNDPPTGYVDLVEQIRTQNLRFEENWNYPGQSNTGSDAGNIFQQDGIVAFRLSEHLMNALRRHCEPFFNRIEERLAVSEPRLEDSRVRIRSDEMAQGPLRSFPGMVLAIEEETGFIAHSSAYMGCDVGLKLIYLKIDNAQLSVMSGRAKCFRDIDFPDPRTRYLHADNTCFDMKMIVYLSDVTDERDGPFSYIQGSAKKRIPFEEFIARSAGELYVGSRTLESRRRLMKLPRQLRKRLDFGSDLLDEPCMARILDREKKFLSEDGDAILFDSSGFHRGAFVTLGARRVLQISLQGTG